MALNCTMTKAMENTMSASVNMPDAAADSKHERGGGRHSVRICGQELVLDARERQAAGNADDLVD
jgi:hypothetical protein